MTQPYKKKLIEVAIPLEAINAASAREKSIRHGHPSTLHLWWARRPLAACRAVLFAQLVDDPSSLPDQFPTEELQKAERDRLFAIIEDLVKWENSTNEEVLERARAEIRRSCGGVLPPVYDPFSGGGSIPLEAQRLGLPAYGSDLNPVAVMIGKAMIEIPPKFKDQKPIHPGIKDRNHYRNAEGLAEDVKFYGEWMREKAWERIGHLYPQVDLPKEYGGGKANVIAWIWARTVPSPDPAFADIQVPVTSSFLLSTKVGKEAWIEPVVNKQDKTIYYHIRHGGTVNELAKAKDGTKAGQAMFRCLFSDSAISGDYVDKAASRGEMGVTLLAVVAETKRERVFVEAASVGSQGVPADVSLHLEQLDFENLEVPCRGTFASNAQGRRYGFHTFKDYFTKRQLVALGTYAELVNEVQEHILKDALSAGLSDDLSPLRDGGKGVRGYAEAIAVYLSFGVSRLSDIQNSLCRWESSKTQVRNLFGRQAIPMMWDFGENNVFGDAAGDFRTSLGSIVKVIERFVPSNEGSVKNADAQTNSYPENVVISTDPPYYDNIEYADLSDFFYVWLRKALKYVEPDVLSVLSTPKAEELVATRYRHGGQEAADLFFLTGMRQAVKNMADHSSDDFPATIYYAFKQSEIDQEGISSTGWATFLQAVVEAGYSVVGTWPMRTEMANRMVASGTNALANSVVLVCRKKEASAETITRAEFIRALKRELPSSIKELQAASIAPADMPQSAIGPGMGVFSRYRAVLESDDSPMSVKAALQLINRELDEYLGGIQGEFDADTRFAITWFEQNGLKQGDYGTANNIATARGISVESVKHAGIVESQAGKVRILRRDELDVEWEPDADGHLTVWECCQHLVRLHEKQGIGYETALMLKKFGSDKAEAVKDLAYILYDLCANKRQDAKEATAYNALIADWSDLTREAAVAPLTNRSGQMRFEV
jgi:putative DNA methylase